MLLQKMTECEKRFWSNVTPENDQCEKRYSRKMTNVRNGSGVIDQCEKNVTPENNQCEKRFWSNVTPEN